MSLPMRFVLARKKDAAAIYETLLGLEGVWDVEVKPHMESRRRSQENLYRGWVRIMAAHTGNDVDMLHTWLAQKFLGTERNVVRFEWKGNTHEREVDNIRSTAKLSMKEMSAYLEQVNAFAVATLGIILPQPE